MDGRRERSRKMTAQGRLDVCTASDRDGVPAECTKQVRNDRSSRGAQPRNAQICPAVAARGDMVCGSHHTDTRALTDLQVAVPTLPPLTT